LNYDKITYIERYKKDINRFSTYNLRNPFEMKDIEGDKI